VSRRWVGWLLALGGGAWPGPSGPAAERVRCAMVKESGLARHGFSNDLEVVSEGGEPLVDACSASRWLLRKRGR
jgi:hypothetical protein